MPTSEPPKVDLGEGERLLADKRRLENRIAELQDENARLISGVIARYIGLPLRAQNERKA